VVFSSSLVFSLAVSALFSGSLARPVPKLTCHCPVSAQHVSSNDTCTEEHWIALYLQAVSGMYYGLLECGGVCRSTLHRLHNRRRVCTAAHITPRLSRHSLPHTHTLTLTLTLMWILHIHSHSHSHSRTHTHTHVDTPHPLTLTLPLTHTPQILYNVATVCFALYHMTRQSPQLTLLSLCVLPFFFLPARVAGA
jgi:hypothetical protein